MKFLWVFHMWNSTGCGSALGDGNVDVYNLKKKHRIREAA